MQASTHQRLSKDDAYKRLCSERHEEEKPKETHVWLITGSVYVAIVAVIQVAWWSKTDFVSIQNQFRVLLANLCAIKLTKMRVE